MGNILPSSSMMAPSMNPAMADTSVTTTVPGRGSLHTTAAIIQTISFLSISLHVPENAKEHFASASEAEHLIFNLFHVIYNLKRKEKNQKDKSAAPTTKSAHMYSLAICQCFDLYAK